MAFISVTAPGDVFGTITAICGTLTSINGVLEALVKDTTPEGRTALAAINTLFSPLVALLNKLEGHVPITPVSPSS